MKDRIPTPGLEGRLLITPEDGSPAFYAKAAMADNPTELGTPFATATMLTDETAALFGMDGNAVPNTAFAWIGKYNLHWWARRAISSGWYEKRIDVDGNFQSGTGQLVFSATNTSSGAITVTYADSVVVDQETGAVTLGANQGTVDVSYDAASNAEVLKGKYIQNVVYDAETIFYVAKDATISTRTTSTTVTKYRVECNEGYAWEVTSEWLEARGNWQYLQSALRDAYPDSGDVDGWEYEYLGIPFENAVTASQTATGTYVGTGTYGSENPNTLTFDFPVKFLVVLPQKGYSTYLFSTGEALYDYNQANKTLVDIGDKRTFSWYDISGPAQQLNQSDVVYYYFAIG